MATSSGATRGIFGSIANVFSGVIKFVIGNFKFSIPLITIVLALLSSGTDAIAERSFTPVIKEVGEDLLSVNNNMYKSADEIIKNRGILVESDKPEGILAKIKGYWLTIKNAATLIWSIVYFVWWFVILIWIAKQLSNNVSMGIGGFLIGLILFWSISTIYATAFIYPDIEIEQGEKVPLSVKLNPFNGIIRLYEARSFIKPVFAKVSGNTDNQNPTNLIINNTSPPTGYVT